MDRPSVFDTFAIKAMTIAFGAWAALVAWGVEQISHQIADIHSAQVLTADKFQHHEEDVLQRLTALEARQKAEDQRARSNPSGP
jgi:hypothetical protein